MSGPGWQSARIFSLTSDSRRPRNRHTSSSGSKLFPPLNTQFHATHAQCMRREFTVLPRWIDDIPG
jgi:hypothetical protein